MRQKEKDVAVAEGRGKHEVERKWTGAARTCREKRWRQSRCQEKKSDVSGTWFNHKWTPFPGELSCPSKYRYGTCFRIVGHKPIHLTRCFSTYSDTSHPSQTFAALRASSTTWKSTMAQLKSGATHLRVLATCSSLEEFSWCSPRIL